MRYIWWKTRSR